MHQRPFQGIFFLSQANSFPRTQKERHAMNPFVTDLKSDGSYMNPCFAASILIHLTYDISKLPFSTQLIIYRLV